MKNNSGQIISITSRATKHLMSLNQLDIDKVYLRVSVKQGGCSGMSYSMDFVSKDDIKNTDEVISYVNFQIVCDSKSLLYLYGMSLDYQDQLIGGGFKFMNPNAAQTCGCGKSFSV